MHGQPHIRFNVFMFPYDSYNKRQLFPWRTLTVLHNGHKLYSVAEGSNFCVQFKLSVLKGLKRGKQCCSGYTCTCQPWSSNEGNCYVGNTAPTWLPRFQEALNTPQDSRENTQLLRLRFREYLNMQQIWTYIQRAEGFGRRRNAD